MSKKRVGKYYIYVKTALTREQYMDLKQYSLLKKVSMSKYLNLALRDKIKEERCSE